MARRSGGILPLLLAGAAAWGYFKYSKMSDQQKKDLVNGWKEKGKRFYDENIPQNVKDVFAKKTGREADQGHTQPV